MSMLKNFTFLILLLITTISTTTAQVDVTFQLDLSEVVVSGNGVHIAGTINSWSPAATALTDPDGDGIYTVTLSLNPGDYHEFKYINGNDWPEAETPCAMCAINTNRYLYVPLDNLTIPVVKFTECAIVGVANVTFQVDMSGQTIDPDGVHIAGYVNGWNPGSLQLTQTSGNIYSVTKQYRIGEYLEYKFVNDNDWPGVETPGADCHISSNRFLKVPGEDVELEAVPFNGCSGTSITFRVDMTGQTIAGEGVKLTGNFNNWNPSNVAMNSSLGNVYTKTFVFPSGGDIEFKYVNGDNFSVAETPGSPCSSNTNRQLSVGDSDQVLDIVDFGGCAFDYLIYESGTWSNITGPTSGDHVSIEGDFNAAGFECNDLYVEGTLNPTGSSALVVNGDLINNGTVEIPSGASLVTMGSVSGDGDFIIHKTTRFDKSTGRYSMVGSPIVEGNSSDLGAVLYQYNESTAYGINNGANRFELISDNVSLTPGKGYFSAFTGSVVFTGIPNTGTINIPLSYTAGSNAGFNLVANPYTAAINAADFISGNADITGTLYIWDDNGSETQRGSNSDYITINQMGVAGNTTPAGNQGDWDGFIRSGQGFFVQSNPSGGTVSFTDAMKVSSNNTDVGFFRNNNQPTLRAIIKNNYSVSDALIGFSDKATHGEDRGLDARKFSSANEISIYSLLDESAYAIQSLPAASDEAVISLGYQVDVAGEYEVIIHNNLSDLFEIVRIYDRLENKLIDLKSGENKLTFTISAGKNEDRFTLLINRKEVITSIDFEKHNYPYTASFYSMKGELIKEIVFESAGQRQLLKGLENRLLLMKKSNSNRIQKIYIQD